MTEWTCPNGLTMFVLTAALVVEKIAYGQAIIAGIGGFSYDTGYPGSGE